MTPTPATIPGNPFRAPEPRSRSCERLVTVLVIFLIGCSIVWFTSSVLQEADGESSALDSRLSDDEILDEEHPRPVATNARLPTPKPTQWDEVPKKLRTSDKSGPQARHSGGDDDDERISERVELDDEQQPAAKPDGAVDEAPNKAVIQSSTVGDEDEQESVARPGDEPPKANRLPRGSEQEEDELSPSKAVQLTDEEEPARRPLQGDAERTNVRPEAPPQPKIVELDNRDDEKDPFVERKEEEAPSPRREPAHESEEEAAPPVPQGEEEEPVPRSAGAEEQNDAPSAKSEEAVKPGVGEKDEAEPESFRSKLVWGKAAAKPVEKSLDVDEEDPGVETNEDDDDAGPRGADQPVAASNKQAVDDEPPPRAVNSVDVEVASEDEAPPPAKPIAKRPVVAVDDEPAKPVAKKLPVGVDDDENVVEPDVSAEPVGKKPASVDDGDDNDELPAKSVVKKPLGDDDDNNDDDRDEAGSAMPAKRIDEPPVLPTSSKRVNVQHSAIEPPPFKPAPIVKKPKVDDVDDDQTVRKAERDVDEDEMPPPPPPRKPVSWVNDEDEVPQPSARIASTVATNPSLQAEDQEQTPKSPPQLGAAAGTELASNNTLPCDSIRLVSLCNVRTDCRWTDEDETRGFFCEMRTAIPCKQVSRKAKCLARPSCAWVRVSTSKYGCVDASEQKEDSPAFSAAAAAAATVAATAATTKSPTTTAAPTTTETSPTVEVDSPPVLLSSSSPPVESEDEEDPKPVKPCSSSHVRSSCSAKAHCMWTSTTKTRGKYCEDKPVRNVHPDAGLFRTLIAVEDNSEPAASSEDDEDDAPAKMPPSDLPLDWIEAKKNMLCATTRECLTKDMLKFPATMLTSYKLQQCCSSHPHLKLMLHAVADFMTRSGMHWWLGHDEATGARMGGTLLPWQLSASVNVAVFGGATPDGLLTEGGTLLKTTKYDFVTRLLKFNSDQKYLPYSMRVCTSRFSLGKKSPASYAREWLNATKSGATTCFLKASSIPSSKTPTYLTVQHSDMDPSPTLFLMPRMVRGSCIEPWRTLGPKNAASYFLPLPWVLPAKPCSLYGRQMHCARHLAKTHDWLHYTSPANSSAWQPSPTSLPMLAVKANLSSWLQDEFCPRPLASVI